MTHDSAAIVRLSKQEFDGYPSFKGSIPWLEERAWFRLGETLGIVIFDGADLDWSYVVMRPDKDMADLYRAVDLGTDFVTEDKAAKALWVAMSELVS